ncbi:MULTISPECIES: IclR family transcriptional regulator [unclassified Arthrobacter]|uniref:IclR family transcriptional regulator n=1 Tax=unclassified Arthrobacter TaxID=235627 RepID=UPI00159DA9EE|nr:MULTISPECIES: IclR family transcriptional regulator [unclassified Arthrobacter]MCQ9165410.1 IclR family transcriptional regulator [Arthrobacter sp. STN4]NVM98629.1 IclR family transcriptional regulator [Arthrobacter sp. SDTb3-6]
MAGGGRDAGRSVTSKVLAILEVFEKSRGPLSLTEICGQSGLPMSTVHRLMGELTDWGLLSRGANGRYQLGIRLWELAQNTGRQLREAARPHVQDLFSLTGETAQLAVREGHEVLYIERIYGTKRVPRASRVGGRLPMHATAVGKVLLAFGEDWVRTAYLNRELERPTAFTHANAGLLAAELDRAREQGYATTVDEMRLGACSIAVPVLHTGRVGAGLGLVLPSAQAPGMTRHLAALRGVSAKIERATAHIPLETLLGVHLSGHD